MILRCAKALVPLAAASLIPLPAQADVLEIGPGGEARWIAGPGAEAEAAPVAAGPIAEVPAEIALVADHAASPPLLASQAVPAAYAGRIHELAVRFDLSPALLEAVVWQESRWRADAVSPVGARGLAA